MPSPWTIDELCDVLTLGKPFSTEPTDDPPWPKYLDEKIRRETAAQELASEFGTIPKAIDALSRYVLTGDHEEVRLTCAQELGKISQVEKLISHLVCDDDPDIRTYGLEFILTEFPDQLSALAPDIRSDPSFELQETLECFDAGKPIPLFYYQPPGL